MASKFSGNGAREGVHSRVHALPHAGTRRTIELRRREADVGHSAHVDLSPAVISLQDSKAGGGADRWRRRTSRTADGRLAAPGSLLEHAESRRDAALELSLHDVAAPE